MTYEKLIPKRLAHLPDGSQCPSSRCIFGNGNVGKSTAGGITGYSEDEHGSVRAAQKPLSVFPASGFRPFSWVIRAALASHFREAQEANPCFPSGPSFPSPLQGSELFTKHHSLISHSPTSMAEQWHLVQYFIKSSCKLTVQSITKLRSLSHINYFAAVAAAGCPAHLLGDVQSCGVSAHCGCETRNIYRPLS